MLDELDGIIRKSLSLNKYNVETRYLDWLEVKGDHSRTLHVHADLLLLNCSEERVERLREYVNKYYDKLQKKERR